MIWNTLTFPETTSAFCQSRVCAGSCSSIQNITAHNIRISPEEILFLQSTFANVSRGGLAIETEDGEELPVEIVSLFEDEIFGF